MPIEVHDASVIREAGTGGLHDGPHAGKGPPGCGGFGVRDVFRNAVRRVGENVRRAVLHDPRPLFVLRGEVGAYSGPKGLGVDRRALDTPRIRNHVRVQLHVPRNTSSKVQVRLPVIVDEDRGIDVARASRATGGDERRAFSVCVRAGRTRGNTNANLSPTGFGGQGNVNVEFPISGDGLWCPRGGGRPAERTPLSHGAVVGPVHHVRGRERVPLAKGVAGYGSAGCSSDVLVVGSNDVHPSVGDERRGIRCEVGLHDRVIGQRCRRIRAHHAEQRRRHAELALDEDTHSSSPCTSESVASARPTRLNQ